MATKKSVLPILTPTFTFSSPANSIHFNYPVGDSNSDTGQLITTGIESLDPPNGQNYFRDPSGRYSDGRLIVDFLMDELGLSFLKAYFDSLGLPSFHKGCNFATAGSTIIPATATSKLYEQGARNFWMHNTGPLGCLAQNVAKFGTDPSKLDDLGCGQYADANITYVDIYSIKSNLITNYSRYGFEEPIMACCGYGGPPLNYDSRIACGKTKVLNGTMVMAKACNDSTEYISWDAIHYTEAANQFVSSQILTGKYSDPPFSTKMPFLLKLKF